jgi:protein-disulfide isomerase
MQRKYVIAGASLAFILLMGIGALLLRPDAAERRTAALAITEDDHAFGSEDAPTKLVVYLDIACENCAGIYSTLRSAETESSGNLKVAVRHLPTTALRPNAELAARAMEAAALQDAAFPMLDTLFETQREWAQTVDPTPLFASYAERLNLDKERFEKDLGSRKTERRIARDKETAETLAIEDSPSIFLEGIEIQEQRTNAELKRIILDEVYD